MSATDTSDDEKQQKKNNVTIHVTYLSIIAIIVLTLFLNSWYTEGVSFLLRDD